MWNIPHNFASYFNKERKKNDKSKILHEKSKNGEEKSECCDLKISKIEKIDVRKYNFGETETRAILHFNSDRRFTITE